jgi:hypothetical protein
MARKKTTNSVVLTARQLLNGYTTDTDRRFMWNTAPYQMIDTEEKDDEWRMWNMDWLEYIGMRQLNAENPRLRKNYDLANGVLNKSDYMQTDENEFSSMIGMITEETGNPFSLKFYPIIPNIIQVLTGEFAKRDKRIIVKATDEYAETEAMEYKKSLITDILVRNAQAKQAEVLSQMGIEVQSQQGQEQMNLAAELAQAQVKFKTYRGIPEQWGQHQVNCFEDRFKMYELEIEGFKDSLIADREFWFIDLLEDDINLELWNPLNVFYHKSPNVNYISEGNYVGHISLMSIPDVIDMYGKKMSSEQIDSLKKAQSLAVRHGNAVDDSRKWDSTEYWDASQPYDKQQPNSIHYEQYMGVRQMYDDLTGLNWNTLKNMTTNSPLDDSMIRVTRAYWKSQRKVGHLTRITEEGDIIQEIVDEYYEVTCPPVYDTSIVRNKSKENLAYGEHIDWIWINQVWGGIKIGANNTTYYQSKGFGFDPIYLDIKPLKFQFKGQDSLYGGKLPVEGRIFSERNSTSQGMVDRMKPFQLGYTIVNNQVMDFLADEVGKIVLIDQNMIPRNSMNGEWGKYNFPRFYQVMKDFQIAPVDSSMQNTENPGTSFSHFQEIDLSKTDQILARLQLAEYFKTQAFAVIGVTPQRVGEVAASESATGVQQAVNNSYSQTEMYFEQHLNFLMPRVYQMLLEAAQYINAEKPESRISYLNRQEESEWFRIEGWKLLLTDYEIYSQRKADTKAIMDQLKNLAIQNNTAGGSLYELSKIITGESPSAIIAKLKEFDDNRQKELEQERQHALQLQREQQQFLESQRQLELNNENYWKEREIQKDLAIAAMKEGSKPADTSELDAQAMDMDREKQLQDRMLKQQEMVNQTALADKELQIEREWMQVERDNMKNDLAIAKENAKGRSKSTAKK